MVKRFERMNSEIKILRRFVEEFSPIHQGLTKEMSYNELFDVVNEIVETHNEKVV